ncbi:MAG: YlbF family regulator [Firmicutes bacterium]|nr:YlbF family regulator [Bacillota bacterium]
MYVYDQAHALAKAIRETDEYKLVKQRKDKVESDDMLKKMFTDYQTKQFEIQKSEIMGQPVSDETIQAFRQVHEIVLANPTLREFMEAENRFGTMMADIQKILVEGLSLG